MNSVRELADKPISWMASGEGSRIVMSSRIRLARNFREHIFPGRAGATERNEIWTAMQTLAGQLNEFGALWPLHMSELPPIEQRLLFERHLVSREHLQSGEGRGVVMRPDECLAVMVNEEDHLRMQVFRPGLALQEAWQELNRLDDTIEKQMPFAYDPGWGYLTACPSNLGTGMRASVMLHLPALNLQDEIGPIVKGLSRIGLMVRGLWGEGSEAVGSIYQISNQVTLGKSEKLIIDMIEKIVLEISEHEAHARVRLKQQQPARFRDTVGRAYGLLMHAHLLTSKETLSLLSGLRLGVETGMVKGLSADVLNELLLCTQPAHMQVLRKQDLASEERDRLRARLVRSRLAEEQVQIDETE